MIEKYIKLIEIIISEMIRKDIAFSEELLNDKILEYDIEVDKKIKNQIKEAFENYENELLTRKKQAEILGEIIQEMPQPEESYEINEYSQNPFINDIIKKSKNRF